MKPEWMRVHGLHSYSSPVEVDFDELGRYGLFGIFGPIGSGKSTLLDAITLALYGVVDRTVGRSRQGIAHASVGKIEIILRFRVLRQGRSIRYEVQRLYRATDGRVSAQQARLSRFEGEERVVLADKEREITETITTLLGLTAQDFMRAVVLPQGRFMKFLELRGQQRREMLQRIFHLESYGRVLRDRVNTELNTGNERLATLRGELEGIGDASLAAKTRLLKHEQRLAKQTAVVSALHDSNLATLRKAEQKSKIVGALRELRLQILRSQSREAEIKLHQRVIAEEQLLRPLVQPTKALQSAINHLATIKVLRVEQQRQFQALKQTQVEHQRVFEEQTTAHDAQMVRDERVLGELGQIIVLIERIEELEVELPEMISHSVQAQQKEQEIAAQLHKVAKTIEQCKRKLRSEKRKRTKVWVSTEDRTSLHRAHLCVQAVKAAQAQVGEVREEVKRLSARCEEQQRMKVEVQKQLQTEKQRVEAATLAVQSAESHPHRMSHKALVERQDLQKQVLELHLSLKESFDSFQATKSRIMSAEKRLRDTQDAVAEAQMELSSARQRLQQAEGALFGAREEDRRAETHLMAGILAKDLQNEAPCPVCGSKEHPLLATSYTKSVNLSAAIEMHRAGVERARRKVEGAVAKHAALQAALTEGEQHKGHLDEILRGMHLIEAQRTRELQVFVGDQVQDPVSASSALLLSFEEEARLHQLADEAYRRLVAELGQQQEIWSKHRAMYATEEANLQQLQQQLAEAKERMQRKTAEEHEAWVDFDLHRGDLTIFDIPGAVNSLRKREEQVEALERSIDQIQSKITGSQEARQRLSKQHQEAREFMLSAQQTLIRRQEEIESLIKEREAFPKGNEDPKAALLKVEKAIFQRTEHLTKLQQVGRELSEEILAEGERLAMFNNDFSAAQSRVDTAQETLKSLIETGALQGIPAGEIFDRLAVFEAKKTDLVESRRAVLEWTTKKEALLVREQVLVEEGKEVQDAVSEEQATAALNNSQVQLQEARSALTTASGEARRVESLHERHTAVCEELGALEHRVALLSHLGGVLRGNRFVEFLANDHLKALIETANTHLLSLTEGRYALDLGSDSNFVVIDQHNGSSTRPVYSLSGGETFLTSLALALALSTQVQARSAQPLEFFFLDEGFGTLDEEALERVLSALEALQLDTRTIGLISHVAAVRNRVPRYLEVTGPTHSGVGTTVTMKDNG